MVPRRPPFWKFDTVDPTSPWFTRSCMKTHEWTFAKVGTTVHDNISEVLIAGSLSYLYSWLPIALFYLHRGTSHIGSCWHVFSGRAAIALDCHFQSMVSTMRSKVLAGINSCFNYELQRFGAAFIPQIWDALISLMTHLVWKRAKTHPSRTLPL